MNIIIDVTYITSGIYTYFLRLLCRKCDVINHGVMKLTITGYCLWFSFTITQNFMHAKIKHMEL